MCRTILGWSQRWTRGALVASLLTAPTLARADRVDDLSMASQDSSYKVRLQAALVLGKMKGEKRAVTILTRLLQRDDNPTVRGTAASSLGQIGDPDAKDALEAATHDTDSFVRGQAQKAMAMLGGGGPAPSSGGGPAKFYLAIGFAGSGPPQMVHEALAQELRKLPNVALGNGAGEPTAAQLNQRKLQGFIVDGSVARLSATMTGGQYTIACDLKAYVATFPGKSVKMMTTEGAELQVGPSERESAKRDCVNAVAESIRDDVAKYLKTVQ